VEATPGKGTNVPLYILGSSLFGATLAAALGLPYSFASHFAPNALQSAVAVYRREFQPSEQLDRPYVIAGVNAIVAESEEDAQAQFRVSRRQRVARLLGPHRHYTDEEADAILESPQGQQLAQMMRYSAVGTPATVRAYLDEFAQHAEADELIVAHLASSVQARLRSVDLLADVSTPVPA
jgi:luciferase family oxidoreductase group 1